MTELDELWSQMLDESAARASENDRSHVAEYLHLRATNDAIRRIGVGWLFDTFIETAGRAMRVRNGITIEREDPYSFARGSSNMVGSLLEIRQGVRCLTIEAGWARSPRDGIMEKGALAFGRITHFGLPRETSEIRLVHAETLPHWLGLDDSIVDRAVLQRHFDIFLGS